MVISLKKKKVKKRQRGWTGLGHFFFRKISRQPNKGGRNQLSNM
jgi:hypothetical protein